MEGEEIYDTCKDELEHPSFLPEKWRELLLEGEIKIELPKIPKIDIKTQAMLVEIGSLTAVTIAGVKVFLPDYFPSLIKHICVYGGASCIAYGALNIYLMGEKQKTSYRLKKIFEAAGIKVGDEIPELLHDNRTESGRHLVFRMPDGMSVNDVIKKKDKIEQGLGCSTDIYYDNGYLQIKTHEHKLENMYLFEEEVTDKLKREWVKYKNKLTLPIGYSNKGLVKISFDSDYSNWLISGQPKFGKSVLLKTIILTAKYLYGDRVNVFVSDLKMVDFYKFKEHITYVNDIPGTIDMVKELKSEMNRRYETLRDAGAVKISEYNAYRENKMPWIIVIFDEFAMLEGINEIQKDILKIVQKGRAAGIHLIIATQNPYAKFLEGPIKGNLGGRIAFKMASEINSRMVLDSNEAFYLPPRPGRCYYNVENCQVQVLYPRNIKMCIDEYIKKM